MDDARWNWNVAGVQCSPPHQARFRTGTPRRTSFHNGIIESISVITPGAGAISTHIIVYTFRGFNHN